MKVKFIFALLLSGLLAGCDSDSDPVVIDASGEYNVTAPSSTRIDRDGGECGDGVGTLTIADGAITGMVTTAGNVFDVSGTVGTDGVVSGGFALGGQNTVDFEGSFDGTTGGGTWVAVTECRGNWQATRTAP